MVPPEAENPPDTKPPRVHTLASDARKTLKTAPRKLAQDSLTRAAQVYRLNGHTKGAARVDEKLKAGK